MQTRLVELHEQRGRLLERIANQRSTLAQRVVPLERAFAVGDRIVGAARDGRAFVLAHPYSVAAAVLTIVVLKPGFVLRWAQRGFIAWRAWRGVVAMFPRSTIERVLGLRPTEAPGR